MWLPSQDSNLGQGIQSPVCYHYTTRQERSGGARPKEIITLDEWGGGGRIN